MKNRLAEAVLEDNIRTELRRLNTEHPELPFFDARDRVMQLMSQHSKPPKVSRDIVVQEVKADQEIREMLKHQSLQMAAQQKQIESLMQVLSHRGPSPQGGGVRRCWVCGSPDHLKRDCPGEGTATSQPETKKPGTDLN